MNLKEKVEAKIDAIEKLLFHEETPEAPVKEKFVEANLEDGTLVNIEPDLELGAAVSVVGEEGVEVAPDGEHVLANGVKVTTEAGIITNIEEPMEEEAPEAEAEEEMSEAPVAEATPKTVIERTEVERKFSEQNEVIESLKTELKELSEKFEAEVNKAREDMFNAFKELVSEPAEEQIVKKKNPFKKEKKENKFLTLRKNK